MDRQQQARRGRNIAILIAATAVLWLVATTLGTWAGLSQRWLALCDLAALAGFGMAFYMIFELWRARRTDKD